MKVTVVPPGIEPEAYQALKTELDKPLDPKRVKSRKQGPIEVSYLKGDDVIDRANQLIGYGNWGYTITDLQHRAIEEPTGIIQYYTARVRLQVYDFQPVEDVGTGDVGNGRVRGAEHDKAIKTAVTDALKRAFRIYGNQFGNSLYDTGDPLGVAYAQGEDDSGSTTHAQPKPAQTAEKTGAPQRATTGGNTGRGNITPYPARTGVTNRDNFTPTQSAQGNTQARTQAQPGAATAQKPPAAPAGQAQTDIEAITSRYRAMFEKALRQGGIEALEAAKDTAKNQLQGNAQAINAIKTLFTKAYSDPEGFLDQVASINASRTQAG